MSRALLVAFSSLFLLAPDGAWAESGQALVEEAEAGAPAAPLPRRARILLPRCDTPPFSEADLLSTLRVELLDLGIELGPSPPAGEPQAVIAVDTPDCSASEVRIRVEHTGTGQRADRAVDAADRPATERGRILAIAVAELVRDAWPDLGVLPEPEPEPEPQEAPRPPPAPPAPIVQVDADAIRRDAVRDALAEIEQRSRAESEDVPAVLLGPRLGMCFYPLVGSALLDPRLAASFALVRGLPLRLAADLGWRYGGGSDPAGSVETHGPAVGFSLLFAAGTARVRGEIGPRLELGWVWAEGQPYDPAEASRTANAFVLSMAAQGSLGIHLGRRVWTLLEAQAGYVVVGLEPRVGAHAVGGVAGPLLGCTLGLAIAL